MRLWLCSAQSGDCVAVEARLQPNVVNLRNLLGVGSKNSLKVSKYTLKVSKDTLKVSKDTLKVSKDTLKVSKNTRLGEGSSPMSST
jgi:hypothetical protein